MARIIGMFSMIAFFGFLGPYLGALVTVGSMLLIMLPRYFFGIALERYFERQGKKSGLMDILNYSFVGFLIQLAFVVWYFG